LLAPLFAMMESLPLGIELQDYPLHEFVSCFNKDVNSSEEAASKRYDLAIHLTTLMCLVLTLELSFIVD